MTTPAVDVSLLNNPLYTEIEAFLLRGTSLRVTNMGRMDPSTELLRRRNGMSGAFEGVRVFDLGARATEPAQNPLYSLTQRESFRLGDSLLDTREGASVLPRR